MPMYACQLRSKYTPTIVWTIMSTGPLAPCLKTICMVLFNDANLQLIFLFGHFEGLMLFTSFHCSSTIKRSCMTVTNWSSCWLSRYLFFPQYCLCVATNTLRMLRDASWYLYFLVIFLSSPARRRCVQAKYLKKLLYKTSRNEQIHDFRIQIWSNNFTVFQNPIQIRKLTTSKSKSCSNTL